ncbi:MAG TPA: cysteine desulfurase-like protein [Herpetosiphonaceae bacterium]
MPIDLTPFRLHFPALAQAHNGNPLIFFDNPGGTQVPQQVIDHVADYYRRSNANTHGAFVTSARTDAVIAEAHEGLAQLLGGEAAEIVLGANMTSLTFAVSRSLARDWQQGDEVIVTTLDHDANITPWRMAAAERGATVRQIGVNAEDCTLDWAALEAALGPRTKLLAIGWASNATGTITDVRRAAELARQAGALSYVDAVQAVPHLPCDVRAIGADFLACSTYKFFGPHAGALWGRREHLERLTPYKVRPATEELPFRWETGTQNHECQAGIVGTLEYLAGLGVGYLEEFDELVGEIPGQRAVLLAAMHAIMAYERDLTAHLLAGLRALPGARIYGIADPARLDERVPTVAFTLEGRHPRAVAEYLGGHGIAVWDGHYYALDLVESLGLLPAGGMVRVGLAHYNTRAEIDRLLQVLEAMPA